jgi:hypothetical protein
MHGSGTRKAAFVYLNNTVLVAIDIGDDGVGIDVPHLPESDLAGAIEQHQ